MFFSTMMGLFAQTVPELSPWDVGTPVSATGVVSTDLSLAYDYIIVGGGTAGCCLAARLSENPAVTVLLLERGEVADTWASKVPLISSNLFRDGTQAARWETLPMPEADNRVLEVMRGEGLGGSSRVNSMVYTRGAPGDYNRWKAMGHPEWGYDELIPYFIKSESTLSQPISSFRGRRGPWLNQTFEPPYQILDHVKVAASNIGIHSVSDINSPEAPAVGYATLDIAIDRSAYRASTYRAFLPPGLTQARKARLKISTKTLATRLESSVSPDGIIRVTGVRFEAVDSKLVNQTYFAKASREIVLCCGAVGSPQLLQLSGFGPRDHLKSKGISVVRDMPGVGSNLQDHVSLPATYIIPLEDSLHGLESSTWKAIKEFFKYITLGRGLFGLPFMVTSLFVHSRLLNTNLEVVESNPYDLNSEVPDHVPDIEVMPIAYNCCDVRPVGKGIFSFLTALLKPKSFGSVRLTSSDPKARPEVDLGFLRNQEDYVVLRKCIRLALRLAEQVRSQGYPLKDLQVPATENDVDVDKFIRANLRTTFHYSSTCRMGSETDPAHPGVVDDELRVHGVEGLRICDTSIFPEIVAAHTMAPVVAVAEKCADMMKIAGTSF